MTMNYPGPYELRLNYTTDLTPGGPLEHTLRLNMELDGTPTPGDDFAAIDVVLKSGGTKALSDVVDDLVALLQPVLGSAAVSIDNAELWVYAEYTFNASYVATYPIGLSGGSAANPSITATQAIMTLRTVAGGNMRLTIMEVITSPGPAWAYAAMPAEYAAIADHLTTASTAAFVGRDGSYPVVALRLLPGQNEATFKRRYRK